MAESQGHPVPLCPVCGEPADLFAIADGGPCMNCVRARAATVGANGRCRCPKSKQRPRTVKTRSRSWVACDRCLGTIRQIS